MKGLTRIATRRVGGVTLTLASAIVLGACGSGSGDAPADDDPVSTDPDGDDLPGLVVEGLNGQAPEDVESPWLVNLSMFRLDSLTPGTGDLNLGLVRYADDFTVANSIDFFAPELDVCDLYPPDAGGGGGTDNGGNDNSAPVRISGRTVTLESMGTAWFMLTPTGDGEGGVEYFTDDGLPGALPADLTLNIEGGAFPALAGYALREPAAPVRLLPDPDRAPTGDDLFTWMPDGGSDYVAVDFLAYDAVTGDFIDFVADCQMIDDGRFDMPQDIRTFLDTTDYSVSVRYERVLRRVELVDNIVVHTRIKVAE